MVVRNVPAVVRVPYFIAASDPENFFYSLLIQYMPYRSETELLEGFNNSKEAFLNREDRLKEMSSHMRQFRERDQQLENAFNQIRAFEILEQPEIIDPEAEEEELPEIEMSNEQFQRAQQAMNIDQKQLFVAITESIKNQLNGDTRREKIFVTGGAGTGKTFLFNLLKNQVNRCYGKSVVKIGALTGVAARLVGGTTLHRLLKLPVQKDGVIVSMPLLTGNYLRGMRLLWQNVEFLFIDEISMVPYEMLCMIDSRLRQLKSRDACFGGINVLLFGDLMQLPPVRGHQVFQQPEHMKPATHLWRLFRLVELKQNMRQQGDTTFIDVLNALRVGELTSKHMEVFLSKVSTDATDEFSIERALRIYPTNDQVARHNEKVLQSFEDKGTTIYTINAQDQLIDATRNLGNTSLDSVIPNDINKTGGLPKVLKIFVGAKVMLRSNIDVSKGLVNGNMGFITEIIWPNFRRDQVYAEDIPSVRIDFGSDGVHVIKPISIQFPAKYSYGTAERRMLPLILSWASTVHKMQGCTVDHTVIYLGSRLFAAGQAYVALSRCRSLDGIRIEDLDCSKLTGKTLCNSEALDEMERLRNNS
ncbi:ATP-dependent DNA helicase PIF1-like [Cotesia glomerata]|uniref:ATP-dependent DNA helicase PIF1-like n=1 Tax=Cotesia glomerata TaxID=32391 RepID=UPI001D0023D2|nr:ATP-dependent DNA helicase PIF1-like [Cotesia glomerata]